MRSTALTCSVSRRGVTLVELLAAVTIVSSLAATSMLLARDARRVFGPASPPEATVRSALSEAAERLRAGVVELGLPGPVDVHHRVTDSGSALRVVLLPRETAVALGGSGPGPGGPPRIDGEIRVLRVLLESEVVTEAPVLLSFEVPAQPHGGRGPR